MKYKVADFHVEGPSALLQTARDLIANAAGDAGFESFEDTDNGLKGYIQDDLLDRGMLDYCLATIPLPDVKVTYSLSDAEYKDWNAEWEAAGFAPININNQVVVYDARHPAPEASDAAICVGIEARQAFGTGTHDTTQMVIAALLDINLQGKRVLDCGCGTGILGIVASRLGASEVVGYDIDEWSVENAKHNAEINGVSNMEVWHGDATVLNHISGLFDVVVANINRNILLHDMPMFKEVMASDATLVLSGFYEDDIHLLVDKARDLGLGLIARNQKEKWCCLVLKA